MSNEAIRRLSERARKELEMTAHPRLDWMLERFTPDGERVLDVLIVGGGQSGLATAFELRRQRVHNVLVVERAPRGREGVWRTYARMPELRTPKELTGPDLGVPSLTYEAWHTARHGAADWQTIPLIRTVDWADYLDWYRETLDLPVRNETALARIEPAGGHLRAHLETPGGTEVVPVRKIVLATGQDGLGRWWVPPEIEALPAHLRAHTADDIDFDALRGGDIVVVGAGASAADNAAVALEAGARTVRMLCRRPELQWVQSYRWLTFSAFMHHVHALDDAWRWRFMSTVLGRGDGIPGHSFQRMARHRGFRIVFDAPLTGARAEGGRVIIDTPKGAYEADFVISGTGMDIDPARRPELADFADTIARWSDRYTPPPEEADERLGRYPYHGRDQELLERRPGEAPFLADIHDFTMATTMSYGPCGAAINSMSIAVPRLVRALTRNLFEADLARHHESFLAYDEPMFTFDEIEWANGGPGGHID